MLRKIGIAVAVLGSPSIALAQPAGIYIAETGAPSTTDGSLVNVAAGGGFVNAPRFATNLANPIGMCRGPGGDIYVAESTTGTVKVATQGGDLSQVTPFAWGITAPRELWCDQNQIFVACFGAKVVEITAGGDFTNATPFATMPGYITSGLTRDSAGTLWLSGYLPPMPPLPNQPPPPPGQMRIVDITNGGDVTNAQPHAQIIGHTTQTTLAAGPQGELFWMGGANWKHLYDATAGGDFTFANPLVTFTQAPWANAYVDGLGLLMSENGAGANDGKVFVLVNNAPVMHAFGLKQYVRSAVHIEGCGDGLIHGMEACDDANALNGDGCDSLCQPEMNGSGGGGGMGGDGGGGGMGTGGTGGTGPSSTSSTGGAGGTGGTGGTGGAGGTGGTGGAGGTGGTGGNTGGAGGAGGGTGGSGGGTGGAGGGAGGAGGTGGTGGAGGGAAGGGAAGQGAGGSTGDTGGDAPADDPPSSADSGCGCRVVPDSDADGPIAALLVAGLCAIARRRRAIA